MPMHMFPSVIPDVGINSTADAIHYKINDISIIKANGHVKITYED